MIDEATAAREELVSEEAAKAKDWLAFIRHADEEDALEIVRMFLRAHAYARIFGAQLEKTHQDLKTTNDELAKL
jgi:hypothetical protein